MHDHWSFIDQCACMIIYIRKNISLTIHLDAVRGRPLRSHSWLRKCQCNTATKPIPIGVHFKKRPRHVNQPPAAINHQSNTDNIVQPAPAFQLHDLRIFLFLLDLPLLCCWCWSCPLLWLPPPLLTPPPIPPCVVVVASVGVVSLLAVA